MNRKAYTIKPESDQSHVGHRSKSVNQPVFFLLIRIYDDYNFVTSAYLLLIDCHWPHGCFATVQFQIWLRLSLLSSEESAA
jgi:hypothetical protein